MIEAALSPVAGFFAGSIIGSFIATLVLRWPKGRGIGGRSECDTCHRVLSAIDLIPILSFALTRGHCRTCNRPIDRTHVLVEVAAALIGALALWLSPGANGITGALLGWQLLTLGLLDARHFWLPDRLTLLLAMTGVAATLVLGRSVIDHLIGGTVGFAGLYLIAALYMRIRGRTGLGGGDPKLLGAIGLWLGWQALPLVLLAASVIGLGAALAMRSAGRDVTMATRVPFGALLAIGAYPLWFFAPHL